MTLEQLKTEISAKRNKDLLMSFGLVPFGEDRERDLMDRYQFIQQFLKESRQFGAQRRASEGQAVQTALLNLSVNAGYADVTRLTLNVESRMTSLYEPYMEWKPVDDVEVKLEIDGLGRSAILCRKGGKALKSVPSRLGKQPPCAGTEGRKQEIEGPVQPDQGHDGGRPWRAGRNLRSGSCGSSSGTRWCGRCWSRWYLRAGNAGGS